MQVDTLNGLLTHPKDYYINMHTVEFGGGLIRDQLRPTDLMSFNVTMRPLNETPPIINLNATAPVQVAVRTIRAEDGSALAGGGRFDVNYRFPADGTTSAPAGLISVYGKNLAKVSDDLSGWLGKTLPTSFNGSKLTIGGKNAPIIYVSPGQINAQVPVDVAAGSQPVIVTNGNG